MFKKILLLIFFTGAVIVIASNIDFKNFGKKQVVEEVVVEKPVVTEETRLCFYRESPTDSGFPDRAWIDMRIMGDEVIGDFVNLPAQTDSKVGAFSGTIVLGENENTANLVWNSMSEGMQEREELLVIFSENYAKVAYGVKDQNQAGLYVYTDRENLEFWPNMQKMDCEAFDDKILVEKFLRENISSIAPEEAVLGGTFYVVSFKLNTDERKGEVVYEDGHIQGKASFNYVRLGSEVLINNVVKID
jgi:hypothetical protein